MDEQYTMAREQFVAYALEETSSYRLESLYETIAEHNGEVAAFGDSWPGALVRIHSSIDHIKQVERQLARLQNRAPRDFGFRVRHPA
jgi:hypothetical protein